MCYSGKNLLSVSVFQFDLMDSLPGLDLEVLRLYTLKKSGEETLPLEPLEGGVEMGDVVNKMVNMVILYLVVT